MDLEFLQCASGKWVPVVNGTLLHSSVDPEREAEHFISKEWDRISSVKSVIVFGLGGGFHIAELLRRKNFYIVVIEAERTLALAMREKNSEVCAGVELLAGVPPAHIAGERAIHQALSHSYAVLRHPASLRSSPYYYSSVSQILNDRTLGRLRQLSEVNLGLIRFFESLELGENQSLTLPMMEEAIGRRASRDLGKEDFIFMALRELVV